jgi:glycosyltransferase involved in cell wall biosynthesis
LKAWSWAAGPIGQTYPLALVGVDPILEQPLRELLRETDLESSVRILPILPPVQLAFLYRHCTALFHPWPLSVWGDPVRHALATGRPVIASKSDRAESLVGPAAYLVSGNDTRGLGGALITIVVEEEMGENLSQAARARSAGWDMAVFQEKLSHVYRDLTAIDG